MNEIIARMFVDLRTGLLGSDENIVVKCSRAIKTIEIKQDE